MSNNLKQPYSSMALVAYLSPITVKNSEAFTTVADMSKYHAVVAVLKTGDVASEGIVFRCVACDSNGANPTATLTGKTITIAAHASDNDSKQYVINLSSRELAALQSTKQYVKFGVVTDNTVGGPMEIGVYTDSPRYGAGSSADLATVVSVV